MAVGFDASGDYARITTNLPDVVNFTVCGFARLKTERNWQAIFSLDDADTNFTQLAVGDETPPRSLWISTSETAGITFASRPTNDTWFFFALKNNGSAAGLIGYWTYLDPISMVTAAPTGASGDFTPTGLYIGNDGYDDYGGIHLAHVRVWDAILSQSELESEAASGTPVRATNLRAYWPLADNTDTGDDSGNGYNLTFGGTLTTETGPDLGETVTFAATITAASNTNNTATLSKDIPFSATITAASATNDTADLVTEAVITFAATITAASSTNNTAVLAVVVVYTAATIAATVTSNDSILVETDVFIDDLILLWVEVGKSVFKIYMPVQSPRPIRQLRI